jgi:hypothetical protein
MTVKRKPPPRAAVPRRRKQAIIDAELARLCERDGHVTKQTLLDAVRDKRHPLHNDFEWNNSIAGEKHRLDQALRMIESSRYLDLLEQARATKSRMVNATLTPVRAYLPGRQEKGPAKFKMRNQVISDADDRAAMVEQYRGQLRGWCRSVHGFSELTGLRLAVESALAEEVMRQAG